jgi:methylaspartate mutase epsilon subunit
MVELLSVRNEMLTDEEFESDRSSAYAGSPMTPVVDLDEAFSFCRQEFADRNCPAVMAEAKASGRTLVQPRAGVAHLEGQRLLNQLLTEAGADIIPITIDSMTRTHRWDHASRAALDSTPTKSLLNGYPLIHHGLERTRALVLESERPVHLRANSTDLRLVADVGFACGMSGFVSGPIYSTVQYSKTTSLAEAIRNWQYVYRLIGKYTEAGIPIMDDALGLTQSASCSVPALMHAGVVLEALMMAAQGVKHVLAYAISQGTIAQDVAACLAVQELTEDYLARLGFADVNVYMTSNHFAGAFPPDEAAAYGLISMNTLVAAMAQATLLYVKSVEEGFGVPTAEGNAASVRSTRYTLHLLRGQDFAAHSEEVEFERRLNLMEGRAILDSVLELGEGDPVQGTIRAFEAGVLDEPAAPSRIAHGDVLVVRDAKGAVRFLDSGNVPIPAEARRLERERLDERVARKGTQLGYEDVVADLEHVVGSAVL